jgi:hypothetical protein
MEDKHNIIIVLDSIQDDYYWLWECFSEYRQQQQGEKHLLQSFSKALKEAFHLNYFHFYEGLNFNGEETLITDIILDHELILELLDGQNEATSRIRITTTQAGIEFLEQNRKN